MTRLLGNNVLLAPVAPKSLSAGGILFPYQPRYQRDLMHYRVLAVGPGRVVRKRGKPDVAIPIELERGDHVITGQIHGNKVYFKDGSIIIEADEIIAKWRPQ